RRESHAEVEEQEVHAEGEAGERRPAVPRQPAGARPAQHPEADCGSGQSSDADELGREAGEGRLRRHRPETPAHGGGGAERHSQQRRARGIRSRLDRLATRTSHCPAIHADQRARRGVCRKGSCREWSRRSGLFGVVLARRRIPHKGQRPDAGRLLPEVRLLRPLRPRGARRRLRLQLPRPTDPLDPRGAHPGRPGRERRRARFSLRHRVPGLVFLHAPAFAVFYAPCGLPRGRLAAVGARRKLIALGLAVWSAMTALSGLARSFPALALARIGVGIGEASAAPAAFSLLSDWFPRERRATVLAIYSSGIYLGAGLGLVIGGFVVDRWAPALPTAAPFGLRGWQAAFLLVGLPGLLLALWVRTLREPARESELGLARRDNPRPWAAFLFELRAVVPPLTLVHLALAGAGWRGIARNLVAAATIAAIAALLLPTLGRPAQWIALAIGLYAGISWLQALALRDRPTYALVARTQSLRVAALGFSLLAFVGYGVGFWLPPFFIRIHGVEASRAGLVLGVT